MTDSEKAEKIREEIAERIYTDWNKSPEFTWEELPDYRKCSYRDWVEEIIFPIIGEVASFEVKI